MSDYKIGANPCPKCRENGGDNKGNNLHFYGTGKGVYCFSCGFTILSDDQKAARGIGKFEWTQEMEEEVATREKLTKEQVTQIKSYTGERGNNLRGITDETYKSYLVRHKYDEETGEPTEQYYPITENYEAAAYKVRILPKGFNVIGKCGKDSDLFGQWKFRNASGKFVVLVAGEIDCLSAYQMFEESRKGDYEPIPVVSSTIGETGSHKQVANHYEWFDRFDKVVVCYDNDKAGKDALKDLVKVLPKGKMFTIDLPLKDVNEMLVAGKQRQFVDCFWKARPYTPDGIVASNNLTDKIMEGALTPKISLPPFMHKLQKMMAGGWPLKTILTLSSASGTGKSSVIEAMMLHWIFHSPYKVGIISLESDASQFATKLLSSHIGHKIDLIESVEDKVDFLNRQDVQLAAQNLWETEDGSARFYLIEDRDGGLESIKALIMNLIITCDVQVILIDPYTDLMDGLTNEEQAVMMRWLKGVVKSHDVSFGLVNHVRKSGNAQKANSTGADLHEEDIFGSSSIMKSSACNLLFMRDKENEDEIIRNTIRMKASKIRWTGNTGLAGEYYYDNSTATLFDKEDWLMSNPKGF